MDKNIIDFLQTDTPMEELATALKVLREFEECEAEHIRGAFGGLPWSALMIFKQFLEHLIEGKELDKEIQYCVEGIQFNRSLE